MSQAEANELTRECRGLRSGAVFHCFPAASEGKQLEFDAVCTWDAVTHCHDTGSLASVVNRHLSPPPGLGPHLCLVEATPILFGWDQPGQSHVTQTWPLGCPRADSSPGLVTQEAGTLVPLWDGGVMVPHIKLPARVPTPHTAAPTSELCHQLPADGHPRRQEVTSQERGPLSLPWETG